jgi:O-antigen/teichoic acid export membrane protein
MLNEVSFVFTTAIFIFIVSFIFSIFGNAMVGLQKIDISKKIYIIFSIINAVGTIIVLNLGLGLKGLIINSAIIKTFSLIVHFIILHNIFPQLRLNLSYLNMETIKRFFRYGIKIQISGLAGTISFQMDKFLIGYFLNMGLISFYELGSKIASLIRHVPMLMLPAIIPAASELDALKNKKDLNKLYFRASKYLAFLSVPLTFFLIILAPLIMFIWMGGTGYDKGVLALRILGVGYFFNIITGVVTAVARGIGVPQYEMKASTFIVISNLLLSIILIIKIGFIGALIGTSLALLVGNIYYIIIFHTRHIKESIFAFIKKTYAKPIFASLIGTLIIFLNQAMLFHGLINLKPTRINYLIFLIIQLFIFTGIYLYLLTKTRFINQEDYKLLKALRFSLVN